MLELWEGRIGLDDGSAIEKSFTSLNAAITWVALVKNEIEKTALKIQWVSLGATDVEY